MEGEWVVAVYEDGEWTGEYEPCYPQENYSGDWEEEGVDFYWETADAWGHIYYEGGE